MEAEKEAAALEGNKAIKFNNFLSFSFPL